MCPLIALASTRLGLQRRVHALAGERHVCAARGLGDNTGVVVAVTINFLVGPALARLGGLMDTTCRPR